MIIYKGKKIKYYKKNFENQVEVIGTDLSYMGSNVDVLINMAKRDIDIGQAVNFNRLAKTLGWKK